MENRNIRLDLLKVIGLLCIILAHVGAPNLILQLRNFDVILMLFISCYLFFILDNNIKSFKDYLKYLKKRVVRLLLPTWFFLFFYFIIKNIVCLSNYDIKIIIKSFALFKAGTIGYVWIIRIYLITALLLPIYKFFYTKNSTKTTIIIYLLYILYEILAVFKIFEITFVEYLFGYIVPILLIIHLSTYLTDKKNNDRLKVILVSIFLLIGVGIILYLKNGSIQYTQIMKYPFRIYYLSYAIAISFILFILVNRLKEKKIRFKKIITYISKNSLWIYLIHIVYLEIISFELWYLNYILIIICTLITVIIKNRILSINILKNNKLLSFLKR